MLISGRVEGAESLPECQVGAFATPRLWGQPVSLTTTEPDGSFKLGLPPGSWYLHAIGGPSGLLEASAWGSYGGIYGQGRPVAVCHTPIDGATIIISPLWRDLTHLDQHRQPALADEQRLLVQATKSLLARQLAQATIADLESQIGLSSSRLAALFRRATGLTMIEYRTRVRLEAAKALLARTDESLLEIALAVGYSTASALSRAFLPLVGVGPGEFRRQARVEAPMPPATADAALAQFLTDLLPTGGRITGEVTYDGRQQGAVLYLFAIPRTDPRAYPALWTALPGPGPFTLEQVPPGRYFLSAYYCRERMRHPGDLRTAFAQGALVTEAGEPLPLVMSHAGSVGPVTIHLDESATRPGGLGPSLRALLAGVR